MTLQSSLHQDRALLKVSGKDAAPFLQRLFTCDIFSVDAHNSIWGALLTPQGRVRHDFIVFSASDSSDVFYIDCAAQFSNSFYASLMKYRMRTQVDVSQNPCTVLIMDSQPSPSEDLGVLTRLIKDPRHRSLGWRAYVSNSSLEPNNTSAWHERRLKQGIIEGEEIVPDRHLPLDLGFDAFGAISWDKGCYVGQEVTARIKHRSLLKRHVMPVTFDSTPVTIKVGDSLTVNNHVIGNVLARKGNIGLVLVTLSRIKGLHDGIQGNGFAIAPLEHPLSEYLASVLSQA